MPFKVAVVGKPRDPGLSAVIREFERRAGRYWPLAFEEVRSAPGSGGAALVRRREAERLRGAVPAGSRVIACDEQGGEMTSREFADWLVSERDRAASLTFVIGGAFGLDDEFRSSASMLLALSRFTLSHELARAVLAEQLYRAGSIMRGEPYHK